ncbi:hypothetical protein ACYOEI_02830 [Singulisphaera rosea]
MDESKARAYRRNRKHVAPCLESLEGRRLMTAGVSQPQVTEGTVNGVPILLVTGTNKADIININDNGTDAVGNITLTFGDGRTYTTQTAVSLVQVQAKGGNDQVNYTLTGDLVIPRTVQVSLGAGNDQFTADLAANINNPVGLNLEAYGNAGNDTMAVKQSGSTLAGTLNPYLEGDAGNDKLSFASVGTVAAGASLSPAFSGGGGNDTLTSNYMGQINGNYIYNLAMDGGAGNDTLTNIIQVGANSTGTIGTSSALPAIVEGGSGNDTINYGIFVDPTATQAQVFASAFGGAGRDTVERTSNVQNDATNENDSVVS